MFVYNGCATALEDKVKLTPSYHQDGISINITNRTKESVYYTCSIENSSTRQEITIVKKEQAGRLLLCGDGDILVVRKVNHNGTVLRTHRYVVKPGGIRTIS